MTWTCEKCGTEYSCAEPRRPYGTCARCHNAATIKATRRGLDKRLKNFQEETGASDQQKAEPGWKQDGGKPRMDLIAPEMLVGTANVLTFGAAKYDERNWEQGMSWGRVFGALMRHMWAWWAGEKNDPETGFSHLHHAACCIMFLIAYEERGIGKDDRAKPLD